MAGRCRVAVGPGEAVGVPGAVEGGARREVR